MFLVVSIDCAHVGDFQSVTCYCIGQLGLMLLRFDPPPREPKVSLPEKLPEVSLDLSMEKEEEFLSIHNIIWVCP